MRRILLLVAVLIGGSTTSMGQMSGNIELSLIRTGEQWTGQTKITITGQQLSTGLREFKIHNSELTFTTNVLESELRFSGKLEGDQLSGTVEGFQRGGRIATGTWVMARQGTASGTEPAAGNWLGTFMLQPSNDPTPQPEGVGPVFNTRVASPAYAKQHPKVFFDQAHNNADTAGGRYKPFAELISSDGYAVVSNKESLSRKTLADYKVLIVVNASGPPDRRDASPFSQDECEAVRDWVMNGGALLLISDQSPFSAAAADLAKRFDVGFSNGFTIDRFKYNKSSEDQTELVFTRDDGLLGDHPITQGRNAAERISRITTFTGTSVKGPKGSVPLLKLADTALDVVPPDHKPSSPEEPAPDHKEVSAAGRAQGIALEFGKGRIVVLSEAAMLTAQVAGRGFPFGMNVPGIDNRQFALNTMHWLSGLLK